MVPGFMPVRSSTRSFISAMGVMRATSSRGKPRAAARLASGSASMASTVKPSAA